MLMPVLLWYAVACCWLVVPGYANPPGLVDDGIEKCWLRIQSGHECTGIQIYPRHNRDKEVGDANTKDLRQHSNPEGQQIREI